MKRTTVLLAFALAASLAAGLAPRALAEPRARAAELLPLPLDWYPESLAVSDQGVFYVGSWRQGAVAR
ncbi:MAG: hypothetical protein ABW061_10910, partial [Polyangiaceae bacterium]